MAPRDMHETENKRFSLNQQYTPVYVGRKFAEVVTSGVAAEPCHCDFASAIKLLIMSAFFFIPDQITLACCAPPAYTTIAC